MARRRNQRKATSRRRRHGGKKSSSSNFSHALRRLKKLKASDQHQAMKMANAAFIRQFCNHLKKLKHTKVSSKSRKVLRKHKSQLRKLINGRTSLSKRRHMLSQNGGGFLKDILNQIPIVNTVLQIIDTV